MVRHADAGDRDEFAKTGSTDDLRPLSEKGREQMTAATSGLLTLVPAAKLIVSSPYTRAAQTAEIVRAAYGALVPLELSDTLEPERAPSEFEAWLRERGEKDVVIAVGHEPHLGILATWLMAGLDESSVEFKKGGAALLVFEKRVKKRSGVLRWLMGPKELKAL